MTWAMIFLLVILKIPIAYLCGVVWWAIKSEPTPEQPVPCVTGTEPELDGPQWSRSSRLAQRVPRGPVRRPPGRRATARAYARR